LVLEKCFFKKIYPFDFFACAFYFFFCALFFLVVVFPTGVGKFSASSGLRMPVMSSLASGDGGGGAGGRGGTAKSTVF
jgi:hypothetical protein